MEKLKLELEKEQAEIKSLDEVILHFDVPEDPSKLDEEIQVLQKSIESLRTEIEQLRGKEAEHAGLMHFEEKDSLNIKIMLIEEENRSLNQQLLDALQIIREQIQTEQMNSLREEPELIEEGKNRISALQKELNQSRAELRRLEDEEKYNRERENEQLAMDKASSKNCKRCLLL